MDNINTYRFFSTQSLNTSIAFLVHISSAFIHTVDSELCLQVPLFSFSVPTSGPFGHSISEADAVVQQIFIIFGFVLLFGFGLIPLLVGIGQPTIGR